MSKNKNKIQGFIKTRHFKKRQLEREVTDKNVLRALSEGEIKEVDGHYRITFAELNIILDYDNNTLITVHPGDPVKNRPKILSGEEAREIKRIIDSKIENQVITDDIDEFTKYIQENAVKKLK